MYKWMGSMRVMVGVSTLNGCMAIEIELDSSVADYRIGTWDRIEMVMVY